MKSLIKSLLREGILTEGLISQSQLNKLEKELDQLFATVGIDIEFTRHFFERVNDARNGKDITVDELREIFKEVYAEYKSRLKRYGDGFEGVFKNPPTAINIPFVLGWDKENKELDLVTKTVMRKKNFHSSTPVLPVGSKNKPTNEPRKEKFKKYKLSNGKIVRYYAESNKFETLEGEPIDMDAIFDSLPEEMQNDIMSKM